MKFIASLRAVAWLVLLVFSAYSCLGARSAEEEAARALAIAAEANDLANASNLLALEANRLSGESNEAALNANSLAAEANSIARQDLDRSTPRLVLVSGPWVYMPGDSPLYDEEQIWARFLVLNESEAVAHLETSWISGPGVDSVLFPADFEPVLPGAEGNPATIEPWDTVYLTFNIGPPICSLYPEIQDRSVYTLRTGYGVDVLQADIAYDGALRSGLSTSAGDRVICDAFGSE